MEQFYLETRREKRIDLAFDKRARMRLLFCWIDSCHQQDAQRFLYCLLSRICGGHTDHVSFFVQLRSTNRELPIFLLILAILQPIHMDALIWEHQ